MFSLLTPFVQAQTSVCTDAQIYSCNGKSAPANYIQKTKVKSIGAKIKLTFYDKSVEVTDSEGHSAVLDESYGKDDEYHVTERLLTGNVRKAVLKYIRQLDIYIQSHQLYILIIK